MTKYENIQSNYNASQLILPLDFSLFLKENDPIFSFNEIMDSVPLLDLELEAHTDGRIPYDFRMMCKVIVYSYMQQIYSLRAIEYACIHDIHYHLLSGGQTPSHKTFGEFINRRLGSNIKELFKRVMNVIREKDTVDMSIAFIDGTKLQANANKYTFVWKRAVIKYLARLHDKITVAIEELNPYLILHYGIDFAIKEKYQPEDIIAIMNQLMVLAKEEGISFKGKSERGKHPLQKHYQTFIEYEVKMMEYLEKIETCGPTRNSYSKTDKDATFMHLKEDYYGGTNLFHAAYNIQIMVSDEYITHVGVYNNPSDYKTFIPMMEDYYQRYQEYPLQTVADAGYGGYDNYMFCIDKNLKLVQKFGSYSIEKSKRYQKKIFHKDNWYRDTYTGDYICPNFKRFTFVKETRNDRGEYLRINQIHSCGDGCIFCPMHQECTSSMHGRSISVNPILEEMKEEVRSNLGTEEGKQLKSRRSAEVEGAFGILKNNWNYDRLHRKGQDKVEIEMYLICLGFNLQKYHRKKQRKKEVEVIN